jgi:acyl-CoA synthetase (AMP-forming)/AMP-acid ligase II
MRVVDMDSGEVEAPYGEPGELTFRGPQVMQGYLNMPDETANALRGLPRVVAQERGRQVAQAGTGRGVESNY